MKQENSKSDEIKITKKITKILKNTFLLMREINCAQIVDNYDWLMQLKLIPFLREVK